MSDAKSAAEAAINDPAEVTQTENSGHDNSEKISDATENGTEAAKSEATEAVKPGEEATKTEESSVDKSNDPNSEENANGDNEREKPRYNDRNGRFDRREKRNGGPHYKNKRRDEFADLPETDDPLEIRAQVEFYFSTQNLSTDEHLFHELEGPKNKPVLIKHLSQFKRMRRFQPYSAIVDALRDSEHLIVVDDGEYSGTGREAVKLKEPLVVPKRDSDEERPPSTTDLFYRMFKASQNRLEASVYVKGFGDEEEAGQIALEQFFKPYGSVMVRKRRDEDGKWKGSVFVEFDNEDSQQQFLALDPKPTYNGNNLEIMGKKEYSEMKCKEKGIKPAWERDGDDEFTSGRYRGGRGGRGGGRGRGRGHRGGGRGGRRDDRDHRDHHRSRRDRSRSPRRRRDRSDSRSSVDSRDWNQRRDRFQRKDHRSDRRGRRDDHKDESKESKGIERDAHGVPVIKDSRTEEEKAPNKRKADDAERDDGPKKSKIEFREDE